MTLNCLTADCAHSVVRFRFANEVDLADPEMTLHLAMFAVEGLLGRARVRLDAEYEVHQEARSIDVDGNTEVGALIVRVFTGLLLREFGEDAVCIQRLTPSIPLPQSERTACA